MNKKQLERLAFLEEAEADGVGAFLFVTEEQEGVYRAVHSGKTYTAERLQALHDANEGLIVMNIGGPASADIPPHPAGSPRGRTLNDVKLRNELIIRRQNGDSLRPEDEAFLTNWDTEDAEDLAAWEQWQQASQPQFDETVRRMDILNAKARSKTRR